MNSIVQRLLQKRVAQQPGLGQGMMGGAAGISGGAGMGLQRPAPPLAAPAMAGGAGMAQAPLPAGPAQAPPEGWADELNRRMRPPTPGLKREA